MKTMAVAEKELSKTGVVYWREFDAHNGPGSFRDFKIIFMGSGSPFDTKQLHQIPGLLMKMPKQKKKKTTPKEIPCWNYFLSWTSLRNVSFSKQR